MGGADHSLSPKPELFKMAEQGLSSRSTNTLFTGGFGGMVRQQEMADYEGQIRSPIPIPGNAKKLEQFRRLFQGGGAGVLYES